MPTSVTYAFPAQSIQGVVQTASPADITEPLREAFAAMCAQRKAEVGPAVWDDGVEEAYGACVRALGSKTAGY
jgi:hypothetical protein